MKRFFCDICGEELKDKTEAGTFSILKKSVIQNPQTLTPMTQLSEVKFDLCEKCAGQCFEVLEKLEKENEKK